VSKIITKCFTCGGKRKFFLLDADEEEEEEEYDEVLEGEILEQVNFGEGEDGLVGGEPRPAGEDDDVFLSKFLNFFILIRWMLVGLWI